MNRLLTYLILLIVVAFAAAGCGGDVIENPKKTDAIVYNTNRYHIGRGLYEHKVMYTYSVDSVNYYGEFIAEDWTWQLTSSYKEGDILLIKYNKNEPRDSKFIKTQEANINDMKKIEIK